MTILVHPAARKFTQRITPVLDEAAFESEKVLRWGADRFDLDPARIKFVSASEGYPTIVAQAGQLIYEWYYTVGETPPGAPRTQSSEHGRRGVHGGGSRGGGLLEEEFIAHLGGSNATRASWQAGWRVIERGERVRVQRGQDPPLIVDAALFEETTPGEGRLRLDKGSSKVQPGWYHARGEEDFASERSPAQTTRVYWNVSRLGAGLLLRALTSDLNARNVPFRCKTLSSLFSYGRADSMVLYFARADWERARPALERAHRTARLYLHAATPALTKRVAYGVGVADDPGGGESFGASRSRVIAEGLWDAHARNMTERADVAALVEERFRKLGLRPEAPHLGPGAADIYELDAPDPEIPMGGGAIS